MELGPEPLRARDSRPVDRIGHGAKIPAPGAGSRLPTSQDPRYCHARSEIRV
jgi:hypothetical protein